MNQDKVNKIYILIFIIILSLPLTLLIFRVKIDDPYSTKKSILISQKTFL
jgi:hypothetical protein